MHHPYDAENVAIPPVKRRTEGSLDRNRIGDQISADEAVGDDHGLPLLLDKFFELALILARFAAFFRNSCPVIEAARPAKNDRGCLKNCLFALTGPLMARNHGGNWNQQGNCAADRF
jgi:hypothetical protein